jgi:DNA replication protein DnaC
VITSNRDISEWASLFGNPLLASAAMDRLLHHAHVLVIEGDSYRDLPATKKKRAA